MPRTSKQEHTELSIEADSPVPLYQRVKQLISQKIYEGSWAVNKKIPSESELVNQLGCSRMICKPCAARVNNRRLTCSNSGCWFFRC